MRSDHRWISGVLVLLAMNTCAPFVRADDKTVLRLTTPTTAVRLLGAHCLTNCWLSGLFAPAVIRETVTAVAVTNMSKDSVQLSASFAPSNGLAMARADYLGLEGPRGQSMFADGNSAIALASGDTAQLKLRLKSTQLPSGLYTGYVQFRATAPNADPLTQATAIEVRIRDSALWALLTVLLGILVGRLAQLVYDPKLIARVQLLDWLHELETNISSLPEAARAPLAVQLAGLRTQLFSRGADAAALQNSFQALETQIEAAMNAAAGGGAEAAVPARAAAQAPAAPASKLERTTGFVGRALRVLAGVTPLSLPSVYDWLLPVFVLLTLSALTVVFMLQQYAMVETFGAGGLADYAALFLAGVASEAIAGGLRSVKLRI